MEGVWVQGNAYVRMDGKDNGVNKLPVTHLARMEELVFFQASASVHFSGLGFTVTCQGRIHYCAS